MHNIDSRSNQYLNLTVDCQCSIKCKDFNYILIIFAVYDEVTCFKIFSTVTQKFALLPDPYNTLSACMNTNCRTADMHAFILPLIPSHFLCDFISCSRAILINFSISSVSFYVCCYILILPYFPYCCCHHLDSYWHPCWVIALLY